MTYACIRVTPDLRYQAGYTTTGLDFHAVGPTHVKPRDAIRYSDNVAAGMPVTSPLRPTPSSELETSPSPARRGSPGAPAAASS